MGDKADLVTVTILGRPVVFRQFNDTQMVFIHRMRQMLSGSLAQFPDSPEDGDPDAELDPQQRRALETGLDTVAKFLNMLELMAVGDGDREWLMEQMLGGNLDLDEIAKFVTDMVPADKKPKTPAKKAVRAR